MQKVSGIEFIFENCECFEFPMNAIGYMEVNDIKTEVARIACNAIEKYQVAGFVALELFQEGNRAYCSFCQSECQSWRYRENNEEHCHLSGSECNATFFSRISQFMDITGIEISYDDGSKDTFSVDYDTDGDESFGASNINQHVLLSELGNLYLVIGSNVNIDDVFPINEINDPKNIEFKKEMMSIGDVEYDEQPFSENNLPELNRYVFLSNDSKQCLAMRVEDPDTGWKFIYDDNENIIHVPTKWQYPSEKMTKFLKDSHK